MVIYIKELEDENELISKKFPKFLKNICIYIRKYFNNITIKNIDENKKVYIIPNIEDKKICKKMRRKVQKEKSDIHKTQLVLSNNLKKYIDKFKDFNIIDGNEIKINLIEEILRKIIKNNTKLELQDIYILTNRYETKTISVINKLVEKVKTINIITPEIEKYNIIESKIYKEKGINIIVANNKKKSLRKAKIIVNMNFTKDEIKRYNINRSAIIINMLNEKISDLKSFDGIIINDIDIDFKESIKNYFTDNRIYKQFKSIELYQSIENVKNEFDKKIKEDKINIKNFYGTNGIICKNEIENWQKSLTNL